ncbi:antibiotic resistance protein [Pigmentiphaga sp. NML080357]|uniref:MarC family protein n=1 Tax=Pigmentiphaga sp. NML080357 TaxID=2008675 RepID=UPI000B409C5E|nr:MarC family protein [Pigmentiphaga sp. NML080357]OVZ60677.1 antibiotic resistance protein [Pigmentiphaga sp. NML080357]
MLIEDYGLALGKSFLFSLATLVPILNPTATAPIFLSLTEGASTGMREVLAGKIARNVFMLLFAAMLIGSIVLDFFGISLAIVRVGGGLLVVASAWRLLNSSDGGAERSARMAEGFTVEMADRRAFYPLTFPIACGPGSIAAAITVGASLHDHASLAMSATRIAGAVFGLALVAASVLLAFRYAQQLLRLLGDSGTAVFLRLSAFILLCLGVQIVWDGASELVLGVLRQAQLHSL